MGTKPKTIIVALPLIMAIVATLAYHNVPTHPTAEDREYGEMILAASGYGRSQNEFGDLSRFENQVRAVLAVQDAVLNSAPGSKSIPFNREREPKDLFTLKHGLCFDRSRVIEKMLANLGLVTLHASVCSTENRSAISVLFTPSTQSHAVTEVKTERGWMIIDSNARWIGLTNDGDPVSLTQLRSYETRSLSWTTKNKASINPIFLEDFVFIRGLYSRHGRFYPPFNSVPDVSYSQLMQNFLP